MTLALAFDRDRLRQLLPGMVVAMLLACLVWQVAALAWRLAVPPAPFGVAQAGSPAAVQVADAFHPEGATASPDTSSSLGYQLLGVRAAIDGEPGSASAILAGANGTQRAYRVGDAIDGGARLLAVAADHVRIGNGGRGHRLEMQEAPPAPRAPGAPPPATARPAPAPSAAEPAPETTQASIAPEQLMAAAGMRASLDGGYTLTPRGDGSLFRRAGLQPGDVLTAIDGQPVDLARLRALEGEAGDRATTRITLRRGNQSRTLVLQADSP